MKFFESDRMKSIANQVVSGINSALAMAPGAQKHLKNLEDCCFNVHLKGLDTNFFFGIEQTEKHAADSSTPEHIKYRVQLVNQTDSPDVTITASPLTFIKLVTLKNKAILLQTKELQLQGDSVRIQQLLAFLNALEIDWEGLLASFIGDVPAHLLGTTIRSGFMWSLNFSQALRRDTEEFIKYELRLLPDKNRAKKQFSAISKLTEEVDKLKLRFDQFELKTKK